MKSCKELMTEWKEDLDALRYQEEIEGLTRGERITAKICLSIFGVSAFVLAVLLFN